MTVVFTFNEKFVFRMVGEWVVVIVSGFVLTNSTDAVTAFLVNSGQHLKFESSMSVHHSWGIQWLEMTAVVCKII